MIHLVCTNCDKKLKVQDSLAGRLVRCPSCQTKLRVPESEAPEELDELEEEESPPEPEEERPRKRAVLPFVGTAALGHERTRTPQQSAPWFDHQNQRGGSK